MALHGAVVFFLVHLEHGNLQLFFPDGGRNRFYLGFQFGTVRPHTDLNIRIRFIEIILLLTG